MNNCHKRGTPSRYNRALLIISLPSFLVVAAVLTMVSRMAVLLELIAGADCLRRSQALPSAALRRLTRELNQLALSPPEGIRVVLNETDILDFESWVAGPCTSRLFFSGWNLSQPPVRCLLDSGNTLRVGLFSG
jgi:hypothetical protein